MEIEVSNEELDLLGADGFRVGGNRLHPGLVHPILIKILANGSPRPAANSEKCGNHW